MLPSRLFQKRLSLFISDKARPHSAHFTTACTSFFGNYFFLETGLLYYSLMPPSTADENVFRKIQVLIDVMVWFNNMPIPQYCQSVAQSTNNSVVPAPPVLMVSISVNSGDYKKPDDVEEGGMG